MFLRTYYVKDFYPRLVRAEETWFKNHHDSFHRRIFHLLGEMMIYMLNKKREVCLIKTLYFFCRGTYSIFSSLVPSN